MHTEVLISDVFLSEPFHESGIITEKNSFVLDEKIQIILMFSLIATNTLLRPINNHV